MQNKIYLSLSVASLMALTSCNKLGSLSADNFSVTPTPLEAVGGKVPATINGKFPEKYMKKKAVVTVTPVLRYANGEAKGASASFQGEKVQGNDQTISYRIGGNYTMKSTFDFVPAMQKSDLYLQFSARVGNKEVSIPEVKVGYGVIATSDLLSATVKQSNAAKGADNFQRIIEKRQEANIKFLIQQANLRSSELKSNSVADFVKMLKQINADKERLALDNIEVSAYASPDGGLALNTKLAEQRQNSATKYVNQQLKSNKMESPIREKYTAEDWDGFKELVAQSSIQDKDVILRVLSMYQEPEEREKQIRNISTVYKELADGILPELRRARMALNYEIIGRSDDEILEQYKTDASKLSVEEMLYASDIVVEDAKEQEAWLKKTAQLYPSDYRAFNNLAVKAFQNGDLATAENYLAQAAKVNAKAPEVNNNLALIALTKGDVSKAETLLGNAAGASTFNETMGNVNIAKGNYQQAAANLSGVKSNSAALAQILNKDYASAATTLSSIKNADAYTDYLKAIVAARTKNPSEIASNLKNAISKDASLAQRAANDLEFAAYANTIAGIIK